MCFQGGGGTQTLSCVSSQITFVPLEREGDEDRGWRIIGGTRGLHRCTCDYR